MLRGRNRLQKIRVIASIVNGAVLACAIAASCATGATSGTVVGATVPATVSLDTTSCSTGPAVQFGNLTPGTATRTTADCTVLFGSSNATSQLLVRQADATGEAMYRLSGGALQTAWGVSGVRTFDLGGTDRPYGAATMQDGGTVIVSDATTGGSPDLLKMIRLTPGGAVDGAFGTVTLPIRDGSDSSVEGLGGVLVDSSGRIVVAGTTLGLDSTVARYLPNGSLDPSFGTGGVTSINVPGAALDDRSTGVVELADGDYLLLGYAFTGAPTDGAVMRIRSDGTVEAAFGGGDGVMTLDLGSAGATEGLLDAVELPNGTLLIAGGSLGVGGQYGIVRMSAAGVPDPTFGGGDGIFNVAGISALGAFTDIAPLPGNQLLALTLTSGGALSVVRLNIGATATVDTTFGVAGFASVGTMTDWSNLRMSVSGTTVTVASAVTSGDRDTVVKRFRISDGAADTSFGTNGTFTIDQAPAATDTGRFVVDGPDGRLTVVGNAGSPLDGYALRLDAIALQGYDDAANRDWATADTPFFGACVSDVTAATAVWPALLGCPTSDGTHWRAMPTGASQVATAALGASAIVNMRFAMRAPTSQAAGSYEAPITFIALAP